MSQKSLTTTSPSTTHNEQVEYPFIGMIILTSAAAILLAVWKSLGKSNDKFPPGPYCIPFVGLFFLGVNKYKKVLEWSKKYKSDIVGYKFNPFDRGIVFLNSYDAIKEGFLGQNSADAFSGRVLNQMGDIINPGPHGLISSEGERWREQRRFALHTLKDLGFGRVSLEDSIKTELESLVSQLDHESTLAKYRVGFDPEHLLHRASANIISMVVFAERLGDDPKFAHIARLIPDVILKLPQSSKALLAFAMAKLLAAIPLVDPFGVKAFVNADVEMMSYLKEQLANHKKSFNPAVIRDYIDAFLLEQAGANERSGSEVTQIGRQFFDDKQIERTIYDLFIAGLETTASTVRWGIFLMAHHPEVQAKMRAEIHEVLGSDRLPSGGDRNRLPFTDAVLCEVQRFASLVPLSVVHRAMNTVTLRSFVIPTDTIICPNLYAVHHDPALWPVPDAFDPEANFLSKDVASGKPVGVKNTENLVPFGVGKRQCLGEALSRQELWIFFVGLFQHFEVLPPSEGHLPPEWKTLDGVARQPLPFRVRFRRLK